MLVIRPPVQPPITQDDWEPPSAFGVHSPEGFKSELSISQLRPYTPSPAVSTLAPSSASSSSVSTPRADLPVHPEVHHVLQKATEALALHAQQSSDSISTESHYSDPGELPESVVDDAETAQEAVTPAESLETAEPTDTDPPAELPQVEAESVHSIEAQSVDLHDVALSEPAVESLQVARPLSPVAGTSDTDLHILHSMTYFTSRASLVLVNKHVPPSAAHHSVLAARVLFAVGG